MSGWVLDWNLGVDLFGWVVTCGLLGGFLWVFMGLRAWLLAGPSFLSFLLLVDLFILFGDCLVFLSGTGRILAAFFSLYQRHGGPLGG